MRNAATFDDDIGFEEPARKTSRKPRSPNRKKKKSKRFRVDMTKVARYAAIGMSATVAIGIMVNALMMQKGHRPAPLFGKAIALGAPSPAHVAAPAARAEATHPPAEASPAPERADATAMVPVPPVKSRKSASNEGASKAASDDPIARLLKASGNAPAEKMDTKTIFGAQQALVKLGFVLRPNGTFGPVTKKAIELFEKDRHLPIKGELSHRLVKILSAESGVAID